MSEWQEVRIRDIVSILGDGLHGTPQYDDNGEYFFINGNNLSNGKIAIKPETKRVSYEEYLKYQKPLNDRTIMVSINGTIGNIALYNGEKCILGKSACYFNVNEDVDKNFIKYIVTDNDFQNYISQFANGTTIKNVSLEVMRDYSFPLPSLPTQYAIAEVLSSLDDKIDLLTRQNATLEALAQTYFRQWFVEGADMNWEERTLGEFVSCVTGLSYKGEYLQPSSNALVTLKNYERTGGFTRRGFKEYIGDFKEEHIVKNGDIIVAHTDLTQNGEVVGNVIIVEDDPRYNKLILTMDSAKIEPTTNRITKEYLYYLLLNNDFKEYCIGYANGSTVLHLGRKAVIEYLFRLPPIELINSFTLFTRDILYKKRINSDQITTLQKLRDTLLPKLINGEVRVRQ